MSDKIYLYERKVNDKFIFQGKQIAIDKEDNIEYEALLLNVIFNIKKNMMRWKLER